MEIITVREINDPANLAACRHSWEDLLRDTPGATFFQSLPWLETYWKHFGGQGQLRVLVVSRGPRAIGILPLVVRTRRRRIGSVRVLAYPLDNWASFYGPIGPEPAATLLAGLEHVRRSVRDWDLIELAGVDLAGVDAGRTPAVMALAGLDAMIEPWQTSAMVDLAAHGNWNAYWASRTSRWRNNVRRSEKKIAQLGEVTYVRYRPAGETQGQADPRWDLYGECERIARTSWQGKSATGTTLTHASIRPFLRASHDAAARAGALDLNLLLVDQKPVAFNYAYHYQGSVFGLRTGYDASAGQQGSGTVLQRLMIEDSLARGDRLYDLGPDYLDCKRYWQTHTQASYRCTHFARGAPVAQLARWKRRFEQWLGEKAPSKNACADAHVEVE
ncbi:MAG TPA: GNAT family N-acetyltransferase [Pirellulales bacterium]|nr:GNAT family N-acetyltransferase [Pirellulales bacterium]